MSMILENRDGLYYCPMDVFTMDRDPVQCTVPTIHRAVVDMLHVKCCNKEYCPVSNNCLTESKLWMLCLGSPGEDQLNLMPSNVTGIPPGFHYHPFRFLDWKEEARVQKQAASKLVEWTAVIRWQFYMDFWIHASLVFGLPTTK
jgi:hypothetical protein